MLNKLKGLLSTKSGIASSVALVGVLALVLFALPTSGNFNLFADDNTCPNPPTTATFNHWPVTYEDEDTPECHDYRAIDAAKYVQGQRAVFSQSESDWQNGLQLNAGEQGVALIYIHNGAANNLPTNQTIAKNVKITTQTDTSVGSKHTIKVTFTADNAATFTESYTVHTPSNAKLEVLPNSGQMYDYLANPVAGQGNLNIGNSTFHLGDLQACFEYSLFFSFKFKVVTQEQPQDTTLSIDKQVRNVTDNGAFQDSVNADRNDKVEYRIKVKNTGNAVAKTVTMTDNSVAGINVDNGSTKVDNLFQGVIPGTLNLGDLNPGQEKTITYTGTVTANSGTLINTATAVASNASQVSDTARVIVNTVIPGTPSLSIDKQVRNVSKNQNSFSNSVEADKGNQVEYRVVVTNTGTATANNVTLTDNGTSGIEISSPSITVNSTHAGQIERGSWSGTLPGTLNLGSLERGQSFTVTYRGTVTANSGTFTNTAMAEASNTNRVSDTATVVVKQIVTPGKGQLKIVKDVNKQEVRTGDNVIFTVKVTNTGDATVKNVRIEDDLSSNFDLETIIKSSSNSYTTNNDEIRVNVGDLKPNESATLEFRAQVVATGERTVCNIAYATGDGVNKVSDDACVKIIKTSKPGTPNIVQSKKAYNDSQNVDATTTAARRGDYITFTLTTSNTGTETAENYVIKDDLSGVLPLADLVNNGGGKLSGNILSFEEVDIKPGQTVTKTFQVRVKESLATTLSFQITNTYGNTVVINIPGKTVFEAPKTGSAATSAAAFAGLITAGFVAFRNRDSIMKFIWV